eukprot:2921310-Alexandrium_andersonii.AAC.1
MAGFAETDEVFRTRGDAFKVVTERRSVTALEWAYNRCINERATAKQKADDLDWYLQNYKHW